MKTKEKSQGNCTIKYISTCKMVTLWLIFAFFLGASLTFGGIVIKYFFPDKPVDIVVKHVMEKNKIDVIKKGGNEK